MKSNFGIDGMMFEAQTVMSNVDGEEPTPFIEFNPIEGSMVGNKFIIGEFKIKDELYDNGDGQLQFSVSFLDKTKKENDKLLLDHIETINKIVKKIVEDATRDLDNA